jgi:polar amino acid transport system substrate-binding protein
MGLIEYFGSSSMLTDDEIEYIQNHKTLIYGADYNSPPLRYVNQDTNQYEGLSIDYFRALSLELGLNIDFKPLIWHDALEQLENGTTDICDMSISKERSKRFLFSDPIYYQRGAILIKKSNNSIKGISDLEGRTLSGNKGDYVFEYLSENFESISTFEEKDLQSAIELLRDNKVEAVLGDEAVLKYFIDEYFKSEEFVILDTYLYEQEAVIGVSKDNQQLLDILNKGINNLNKKKTMEKINQKWFSDTPLITKDIESQKFLLIIKYISSLILFLSFVMYYWNKRLKQEVIKRTNELFLSNNELQTILNGLTHYMIVIDDDCIVTEANMAFCNSVNFSKEAIKNTHCFKINGILGDDCSRCFIKETFEKETPLVKELQHQNKYYKVNTFILEQLPNTKKRVLVMMEDITDSKISELKLRQSGKMAAIGQLAAGIAHEIRNPNGIIRNTCYLLKNSFDNEEDLESIEIIESSVERSNKIIDNLLNFSRITDNIPAETNMNKFISNILALNKKSLISNNIECELECNQQLSANIYTESLKHVLINLISNSVDAMTDGGKLTISVLEKNSSLILRVADTGTGIDDTTLQSIFNPFFTTKDPGSGTGLGLYITYNEIINMRGALKIDSALGEGTTFTITIPTVDVEGMGGTI